MNTVADKSVKAWFKSGSPWVWMTALAVSLSVIAVLGLLMLIAARGLVYFWPHAVYEFQVKGAESTPTVVIGEIRDSEDVLASRIRESGVEVPAGLETLTRRLVKTGNRDLVGLDFRWILARDIVGQTTPEDITVFERREWGNFYGYVDAIKENGNLVVEGAGAWTDLPARMERTQAISDELNRLEKKEIGGINYQIERLRLRERKAELAGQKDAVFVAEIEQERVALQANFAALQAKIGELNREMARDVLVTHVAGGKSVEIPLAKVVRVYRPNELSVVGKAQFYLHSVWNFVSGDPREANTEGGIFPAIFGTVLMVIIMSVLVTPFGVIAAVYLREYASQGFITRIVRIAVNNLAGVPAIVYGVFGLGFFVYFVGGNIDRAFFPEMLPTPTFGTSGILWASLTLAILTLPVVIVATEEGLSRIPRNIREGSLALGATKWETLWRTVLPMASPAIMTGVILAIARAAGEVAPLMLVGVVKLAPSLPLDGNFPFLHLDRKFMHLGFHIYDVGFQSPNVEAARPLVYATALLLVLVIVLLNLAAITIRNRLREKYKAFDQ